MIDLTNTVINPTHIEEAYVAVAASNSQCSDGQYIIRVDGRDYYSPTKAAVVAHYVSGLTRIYGGSDGNTLWVGLGKTPICVDPLLATCYTGYGLSVWYFKEDNSFMWDHISRGCTHKAEALMNLLDWVIPNEESLQGPDLRVDFEGGPEGGLIVYEKGDYKNHRVLVHHHM